jgi:hypothetical protein
MIHLLDFGTIILIIVFEFHLGVGKKHKQCKMY